jgi:hypothetical protein
MTRLIICAASLAAFSVDAAEKPNIRFINGGMATRRH